MNTSDPLFNTEASRRYRYYPPTDPFGMYLPPWLWDDGYRGGHQYAQWDSIITNKMNEPSYVTLTMWGDYSPLRGSGTIYARFRNDSTGSMRGSIRFMLIEDSVYYAAPNNDFWHCHTPRDYLPDTSGTQVNLIPNDTIVVSRNFTTQPSWNANQCYIITWFQNDSLHADSSKPVYQAGIMRVTELVGLNEVKQKIAFPRVKIIPNPCIESTNFCFDLPAGTEYSIVIFDVAGRDVRTIKGISKSSVEQVRWNQREANGKLVYPGVYFYAFRSEPVKETGKLVIAR